MNNFLLEGVHVALRADAKLNSHPIVQKVRNPEEINAIFDVISYQKVLIKTFVLHNDSCKAIKLL